MRGERRPASADSPRRKGRFLALCLLTALLWASPGRAAGPTGPSLALHLTLPYGATAPGGELVVYAVLRNRGDRPLTLPAFSIRMETEVEGRRVLLLDRPAPAAGEGKGLLGPGEFRAFRFAAPLDRRLFLPGTYRLVVRLVPGRGPALEAEAAFTVRYTRVFFY